MLLVAGNVAASVLDAFDEMRAGTGLAEAVERALQRGNRRARAIKKASARAR